MKKIIILINQYKIILDVSYWKYINKLKINFHLLYFDFTITKIINKKIIIILFKLIQNKSFLIIQYEKYIIYILKKLNSNLKYNYKFIILIIYWTIMKKLNLNYI